MKIILPDDVSTIINKLTENGYEAYAVGGCVRDSILCREPGDWDITTSAKPEQVKALFRRTIDTGIAHGTVTVMIGRNGYEVTTYRVDGEYEDNRHPKNVEFTPLLSEDLKRRDFTINAMAYNDEDGMVDLFDGNGDIERKLIRCVGNPEERFGEDALRILRAVRFSAQLGFDIEENTCQAIRKLAYTLDNISRERIHSELGKLLLSPNPDYINRAYELGITKVICPVYDTIKDKNTVLQLLCMTKPYIWFRYAAVFVESDYKSAEAVLRGLKLDNNTISRVSCIIRNHGFEVPEDEVGTRRCINATGYAQMEDVVEFECIYSTIVGDDVRSNRLRHMIGLMELIRKRGDCTDYKGLAIKGSDLIAVGMTPGKEIGEALKICLELVLEKPECNTREILLRKLNIE